MDSIRSFIPVTIDEFVEERILPNAEKTMAIYLTEQEQTAVRLLLSA